MNVANNKDAFLDDFEIQSELNTHVKLHKKRNNPDKFIQDKETDYLHVLITSEVDECSKAKLEDVINLNLIMKKRAKYFKSMVISYMSSGNQNLRK